LFRVGERDKPSGAGAARMGTKIMMGCYGLWEMQVMTTTMSHYHTIVHADSPKVLVLELWVGTVEKKAWG